jgi:protein SERAC1
MWLRDWLGQDLRRGDTPIRARILTYGYPLKAIENTDDASLHDLGQGLLTELAAARQSSSRPLLLIGHSLGGLVVKQVSGLLSFGRNTY